MPLLFSNFYPVPTDRKTYSETFKLLLSGCDELNIATGYISTDSIVDLTSVLEANNKPSLNLCIGMHYFEGVSVSQKQAIDSLSSLMERQKLGAIYFNDTFPFHGKIASFRKGGRQLGAIVGSSNLSNIISGGPRQYEADYLFEGDASEAVELNNFVGKLIDKSASAYPDVELTVYQEKNELLNDQYGVEKVPDSQVEEAKANLSELSFRIPLKADEAPGSNINKHFGKGRENQQGFITPRSWYEVELIVPKSITSQTGYPKADSYGEGGVFKVITDDGWKFKCKVSGTNSKNICSDGDMKILGKWLKGRLENAGVLKPGERVTDSVLEDYGRNFITMTKLKNTDAWYLDFGIST